MESAAAAQKENNAAMKSRRQGGVSEGRAPAGEGVGWKSNKYNTRRWGAVVAWRGVGWHFLLFTQEEQLYVYI